MIRLVLALMAIGLTCGFTFYTGSGAPGPVSCSANLTVTANSGDNLTVTANSGGTFTCR